MKKLLALLLAIAMVATMAACGAKEPAPAETKAPAAEAPAETVAKTGVELTYWSMWNATEGQAKVITEAAQAYEAKTGVHINLEFKGRDIRNLIGPALDAGEKIDIFDTDYMVLVQQNGKYLADLTDMVAAADYEKHALPNLIKNVRSWSDGKLLAIPYQPYTTGVWYNQDMFDAAGITETPTTWAEFLDVCQKLKDSGVNAITCNSDGVTLLYGYQMARYVGQARLIEILDNVQWAEVPEAKKAAEEIQSLFTLGYMSENAPAQYPEGQNEIGFGESAMILNASWVPNEINQNTGTMINWGFFPWPTVEGGVDGTEGTMCGAQGLGLVAKSEHQQEAFDFMMTLVTGEFDKKMADAVLSIPADVDNAEWPSVVAGAEPYFKLVTKSYDWAVGLENNGAFKDFVFDNLIKLVKQEYTPDQFIDAMASMK